MSRKRSAAPEVYEPAEDTALLVAALRQDPGLSGARAADVGTGSGAVGAAMREAGARVVSVDVNPHACAAARARGLDVVRGDLTTGLRGPFDIVAFNAPYLPSEPEERVEGWLDHAFHGGEGGVEVSERFARDLPRVLAPRGRGYLVVSSRADLPRLRGAVPRPLRVDVVGTARFFFEEIQVWKLS